MSAIFKVATFNANSIRARMPILVDWLSRQKPDVLCIQETKVVDQDFPADEFTRAGYHVIFRGQKGYAGVAVATLEKPYNVAFGIDDGETADEPRLIRLKVGEIDIVNTYVPQGRSVDSELFTYKLEWFKRLREYFSRHFDPTGALLWCGDFNVAPEPIDVHNPTRLKNHVDFHPDVRVALERVREWGFLDVFRRHHPGEQGQYTFWDYRVRAALKRNIGWRVDHIWATVQLAERSTAAWIDRSAREATRPSDHTFLVAEFSP